MSMRSGVLLIVLAALVPPASAADSMRCASRIVTVEARAAEVIAACGMPAFRDAYPLPGFDPRGIAEVEQWTYNFGRNQLLHVLRLRHGRLVDIRTDGYGFAPGSLRCDANAIVDGLSKYRLLTACGEPLTRREIGRVVSLQPRHRHRHGGFTTSRGHVPIEVWREEWVYNFGPNAFLKVLRIEDGMVTQVENGERGFHAR
jgi:hypothetical protein